MHRFFHGLFLSPSLWPVTSYQTFFGLEDIRPFLDKLKIWCFCRDQMSQSDDSLWKIQTYYTYSYIMNIIQLAFWTHPPPKKIASPVVPVVFIETIEKHNRQTWNRQIYSSRPEISFPRRPRSPRRQATKKGATTPAATELTINTASRTFDGRTQVVVLMKNSACWHPEPRKTTHETYMGYGFQSAAEVRKNTRAMDLWQMRFGLKSFCQQKLGKMRVTSVDHTPNRNHSISSTKNGGPWVPSISSHRWK